MTLRKCIRERPLRAAEVTAHVASVTAVSLTVLMVGTAQVTESNPVAAWLIAHGGLHAWGLLTPIGVAMIFAACRAVRTRGGARYALAGGVFAAGALTLDAAGNLAVIAVRGLPETVHWGSTATPIALVAGLAVAAVWRPDPRTIARWIQRTTRSKMTRTSIQKRCPRRQTVSTVIAVLVVVVAGIPATFAGITTADTAETMSSSDANMATGTASDNYIFEDSFEDEPADSGLPEVWAHGNHKNGSVGVTSTVASAGSQSAYVNTTGTDEHFIGPEEQPYSNGYLGNVSVSIRRSSASESDGVLSVALMNASEGNAQDSIDVRFNATGLYQHQEGSSDTEITTAVQDDEWVDLKISEINTSADTYTLEWGSPSGSGTVTDIPMEHPMTNGYAKSVFGSRHGAKINFDNVAIEGTHVSGTVVDGSGTPVAGAIVKGYAFNYDNFTGTLQEIREEINGIQENISDPTPPQWDGDPQITGDNGLMQAAQDDDQTIAVAHTTEQWDLGSQSLNFGGTQTPADPDLTEPQGVVSEGDTIILSAWDVSSTGIRIQDVVDRDLPGKTTKQNITVEQVGLGGSTISSTTHEPHGGVRIRSSLNFREGFSKIHNFVEIGGLSRGFYRIYPEDSPESAYIIAVAPSGDVEKLKDRIKDGLNATNETLSARSQRLQDHIQDGTINSPVTATTDDDGEYTLDLNSQTVDEVSVFAYKGPAKLGTTQDGDPPDQGEITSHYETAIGETKQAIEAGDGNPVDACEDVADSVGSSYVQDGVKHSSVPSDDVTLRMREVALGEYVNTLDRLCYKKDYADYLRDNGYEDLLRMVQNQDDLTKDELVQLYGNTIELAGKSESVCRAAVTLSGAGDLSECNGGASDDDGDGMIGGDGGGIPAPGSASDATEEELRAALNDMEQTIRELRDQMDTGPGELINTDNGTVSLKFLTSADVDNAATLVKVRYSNGTTITLNGSSEYIETDSKLFGQNEIRVIDYPLGDADPAAVTFELTVADDEGVGKGSKQVTNPAFGGQIPQLDSVRFSKLEPGPDERVRVRVMPADVAQFGELTNVTVTAPDGSDLPTHYIEDGRKSSFKTAEAGPHTVRLTFTSDGGTEFVETVRIRAHSVSHDLPPTVRGEVGPTGQFAVVSGLDNARIDVQEGGQTVDIAAIIGQSADVPPSVDVHLTNIDVAQDTETTVRLLRGDSEQQVRKSATINSHMDPLGEDAVIYRSCDGATDPLPRSGSNQYGGVDNSQNQTVIGSYTCGDGTLTLRTVQDPGRLTKWWYEIQLQFNWLPGLFADLSVGPGTAFGGAGWTLLLGLGGVISCRRWSG